MGQSGILHKALAEKPGASLLPPGFRCELLLSGKGTSPPTGAATPELKPTTWWKLDPRGADAYSVTPTLSPANPWRRRRRRVYSKLLFTRFLFRGVVRHKHTPTRSHARSRVSATTADQ